MVEKASRLAFLPNSARIFFVCKQQRRRSASAPAQFYQLSLESMIAKPATCKKYKIKFLSDMRARIQTIPTEGGGGSNCFSREVRTSFYSRKQMATYDFHGEVRTPLPPLSPPISECQSVWIHIFFFWAWSIHKTSANYISWRQGQRQHDLFTIKETAHINSGHVLF